MLTENAFWLFSEEIIFHKDMDKQLSLKFEFCHKNALNIC